MKFTYLFIAHKIQADAGCHFHMLQGTLLTAGESMMTSSNGNIFRVTGPLWGESLRHNNTKYEIPMGFWNIHAGCVNHTENPSRLRYPRELQIRFTTLQSRDNERDGVSSQQPYDYLLKRLSGRRSKKTSKLGDTGLCASNSPVTAEFPAQMASNAENVSIWWRHHDISQFTVW